MAQEVVRRFTCDRCKNPYNETPEQVQAKLDQGKGASKPPPLLYVEIHIGPVPLDPSLLKTMFEDLCPKCEKRCQDLVAQIRLDKKDEGDKNTPDPKEQPADGAPPKKEPASEPEKGGQKPPPKQQTH